MMIKRKFGLLFCLISLFIIIVLSIKINLLTNEIKNINKLPVKDTVNKSIVSEQMKFNSYRVFLMPENYFVNISKEKKYKAYVGLSVNNTEWEQPYVIISDSISEDGCLLGQVDTFYTDNGLASIEKEYSKIGEKKLFGKYVVKFLENAEPTVLDFDVLPIVINTKDSIEVFKFFLSKSR